MNKHKYKYIVRVYFYNGKQDVLILKASEEEIDTRISYELFMYYGNLDNVCFVEYMKFKEWCAGESVRWFIQEATIGRNALKELLKELLKNKGGDNVVTNGSNKPKNPKSTNKPKDQEIKNINK